ncbi:MAG: glycerol-3-phosphate dehydrogenase/oxidase [Myxococcota bacterium]|nr:glycerol-3-phosphate dehydrogenase/oxidase [Myxococcota bacterium]
MDASQLGPDQRQKALARLEDETFDVVIIGGGVTGTGAALEAATRGLSVALVEQRDWASGTSSRSSKLIHGGLRYLEQLDFELVREAKQEQSLMLGRLCPHLVRPIPFLFPLSHPVWERAYVGAGILLYDFMGRHPDMPRHRHLTRSGVQKLFPGLEKKKFIGGILYYDAQVDDARHTLALARTAALHGATLASSARVEGLTHTGSRVTGAKIRCLETGQEIHLRGRQFINATGVWTDRVQKHAGRGRIHVRASKGIHLVVPKDRILGDSGLILRTEKSVLFVIPWSNHWIIGTTDTDWNLDLAHPAASRTDVDYLLERVNTVLASPLGRDDIEGIYAGLRPLLQGETDDTSELSRHHAVSQSVSGLITVAGGKYTTYRLMARDAIDLAVLTLSRSAPPSCTDRIPLIGATGYRGFWNRRDALSEETGLSVSQIEHLLARHGSRIEEILELIAAQPDLGQPLVGAPGYLRVEPYYAATHESALHLEDVLTRRTRISIETFDRGLSSAAAVADLMGEVLGWDELTREREIAHYQARVEAERDSQQQPDDHTADAARLGAPDVRMGHRRQAPVVQLNERRHRVKRPD